jgi:Family of unknown function (DUF6941)
MPASPILPRCKALLLCDQVLVEEVTGRMSLIGIMDYVQIDEFPAEFPRCQVFLQITNGLGVYNVTIEIHDLSDNSVIYRLGDVPVEMPDRLARVSMIIRVPRVEIPHPGEFDVVVLANEEEIERQSLELTDNDESGEEWQSLSE